MKKILALLLTFAMVLSLFTILPVSAATTEKTITGMKIAAAYSDGITDGSAGYNVNNMIDGNAETFGAVGSYWSTSIRGKNMVVIDLGKAYDVSEVAVTMANDISGIYTSMKNYSSRITDVPRTNFAMKTYLSNTLPTDGDTQTLTDVTEINLGATVWSNYDSLKWTDKDASTTRYRYLIIANQNGGGNSFVSLKEVSVKAMVEEDNTPVTPGGNTVTVNKNIISGKTATALFTSNGVGNTVTTQWDGHGIDKITDGDASTFGIVLQKNNGGHLLYYDLEESTDITKVVFNMTLQSTAKAITEKETNARGFLFVADNAPEVTDFDSSTWALADGVTDVTLLSTNDNNGADQKFNGQTKTYTNVGSHRYVGVYVPFSYGIAVNELEVYADVEVEAEAKLVSKNKAVFSTGDSVFDESGNRLDRTYAEMNVTDGNADTYYASKVYSGTYAYDTKFGGATSVATQHFYRDYDIVIDLGETMSISKVELTPYISQVADTTSVKYTVGVTDDYSTLSGMAAITTTEVGYVSGQNDNEKKTFEKNASGRYVVINVSNMSDSASEILAGVREVSVYGYPVTDGIEDTNTQMVKISNGRKSLYSGALSSKWTDLGNTSSIVNDGCNSNGLALIGAESGKSNYYIVDLGKAYPISAINFRQINGASGFHLTDAVQIVATNTEVTSENISDITYDVIAKGSFGAYNITRPMYARITNEPKYRYVGIKGVSGMDMPMREFTVWTSDTDASYIALSGKYESSKVSVSYEAEAVSDGTYTVFAAGYDKDGVLKAIASDSLTISESKNFAKGSKDIDVSFGSDVKSAKLFIFDNTSTLKPIAASADISLGN